jgi:hypothetical protein
MSNKDTWEAPPLDPEDEALISAYVATGIPVDQLPHTNAITQLVEQLNKPQNDQSKHLVFTRLLRLRKMGRLPRLVGASSSSSGSTSSSN